ncbi:MAG: rRNA maturation RNase YbeY [Candidatus Eisenbacteria bacterium]
MAERVRIRNRQRKLTLDRPALRRLLGDVLTGEGIGGDRTVEVAVLRDAPMAELNARFRQRAGPTDVLSFPTDPSGWPCGEPMPLGEVIVSIDRACDQAAERGICARAELERLLVHGLLHLIGYRDHSPAERARMRRRENRYLRGKQRARRRCDE